MNNPIKSYLTQSRANVRVAKKAEEQRGRGAEGKIAVIPPSPRLPFLFRAGVAGLALTMGTSMLMSPAHAAPETARSADSFVDSIGINTHLSYSDSVYFNEYDSIIKPKLQKLGVRHIRDAAVDVQSGYLERLNELKTLGISSTLVRGPNDGSAKDVVPLIKKIGGGAVVAITGPNEAERTGNSNWANDVRSYQQQLYQAIKGDSATSRISVLGPVFSQESAYSAIGDLSAFVDYVPMNNYYSGRNPGTLGWGSNGYGSIAWNVRTAKKYAPSKPVMTTETGYHNTLNTTNGHKGVPEAVAAKYMPRLYLEQYNYGVRRTFQYEFINVFNEPNSLFRNFGLLRHDGSEKPAFTALANLIGLLEDQGSKFTPQALDYALGGNTTNLHHTLLQKSDKKFYLILWQEVPCYEMDEKRDINVPNQKVTLTLNTRINKATTYLPNNSSNSVQQITNPRQIDLDVPDYPLVVELEPG